MLHQTTRFSRQPGLTSTALIDSIEDAADVTAPHAKRKSYDQSSPSVVRCDSEESALTAISTKSTPDPINVELELSRAEKSKKIEVRCVAEFARLRYFDDLEAAFSQLGYTEETRRGREKVKAPARDITQAISCAITLNLGRRVYLLLFKLATKDELFLGVQASVHTLLTRHDVNTANFLLQLMSAEVRGARPSQRWNMETAALFRQLESLGHGLQRPAQSILLSEIATTATSRATRLTTPIISSPPPLQVDLEGAAVLLDMGSEEANHRNRVNRQPATEVREAAVSHLPPPPDLALETAGGIDALTALESVTAILNEPPSTRNAQALRSLFREFGYSAVAVATRKRNDPFLVWATATLLLRHQVRVDRLAAWSSQAETREAYAQAFETCLSSPHSVPREARVAIARRHIASGNIRTVRRSVAKQLLLQPEEL